MHKSENLILGYILRGFAFSEKKFGESKVLPCLNHFLKIQWEIHFFIFLNPDRNTSKIFRIVIWTFSFQICFQNKFSTPGSGQTENMQIRLFGYAPRLQNFRVNEEYLKNFGIIAWNRNLGGKFITFHDFVSSRHVSD